MMNAKGIAQIRKNWKRLAGLGTKRLAQKGHFVVYTVDGKRFEIPLDYLNNRIVGMLLKLSEEEFGYSAGEAITLSCDGDFMEYVMDLVRRRVSKRSRELLSTYFSIPVTKLALCQAK